MQRYGYSVFLFHLGALMFGAIGAVFQRSVPLVHLCGGVVHLCDSRGHLDGAWGHLAGQLVHLDEARLNLFAAPSGAAGIGIHVGDSCGGG